MTKVSHDCPLDYASLAHLGPIVPTLKGRRIVGSWLAWHQKYSLTFVIHDTLSPGTLYTGVGFILPRLPGF